MAQRRKHRGYVLLLTLVMLALAAVSLHAVVLRGMEAAVMSVDAAQDLQRRWGMASVQQVILPQVPATLQRAELAARRPVASLRAAITLGGQRFDLILADEQAKANVNILYDQLGKAGLTRALEEIAADPQNPPDIALRPLREPTPRRLESKLARQLAADLAQPGQDTVTAPQPSPPPKDDLKRTVPPSPPAFVSFSQLFPTAFPADLLRGPQEPLAMRLTCWGDGRLTIRRASAATVAQACAQVLSKLEIRKLLEVRSRAWNIPVVQILNEMNLVEVKRIRLEAMLTGRSNCHSLWIMQRSDQRSFYRFAVQESTKNGRVAVYEW